MAAILTLLFAVFVSATTGPAIVAYYPGASGMLLMLANAILLGLAAIPLGSFFDGDRY